MFGEVTSSLELAPEGTGYRMRTRFNKFINLPELIHLFKEVADIILPDMLDIKRPELKDGKYKVVVSEASDYVKERMQEMVERAEAIHRGVVDPKDDNMLRITGKQDFGSDPRLLDSYAPVDSDSKLNKSSRKHLPGICTVPGTERNPDCFFGYWDTWTWKSVYCL